MTDPVQPRSQSPTILLVEDEPAIRTLIRRMLDGAGYELLVARNGDEAMSIARRHSGVIDLLLTDVVMPRLNGFELGELIACARPETNMLFVSGHFLDSDSLRRGLRTPGRAFLLTPFTQDACSARSGKFFNEALVARDTRLTVRRESPAYLSDRTQAVCGKSPAWQRDRSKSMPRPASARCAEGACRQYSTENKVVGHGFSRAIAGLKAYATPGKM